MGQKVELAVVSLCTEQLCVSGASSPRGNTSLWFIMNSDPFLWSPLTFFPVNIYPLLPVIVLSPEHWPFSAHLTNATSPSLLPTNPFSFSIVTNVLASKQVYFYSAMAPALDATGWAMGLSLIGTCFVSTLFSQLLVRILHINQYNGNMCPCRRLQVIVQSVQTCPTCEKYLLVFFC